METSKLKNYFGILFMSACLILPEYSAGARLSVLFGSSSGSNGKSYARVFVTSTTYDGNLGGIAGADAKCQARAEAASLGGTWKAIISDTTTTAKSRMKNRLKPVYNLAGALVWNPSVPLMFSSDTTTSSGAPPWGVGSNIASAIDTTELGTAVPGAVQVWTGTNSTGATYSTLHCTNWTSTAGNGAFGNSTSNSSLWILSSSVGCTNSYHLYCLEDE